jgi:hypothetical protein
MKHASTREVFDYWNTRRGHRIAPERGDIEPGAIRRALADSFILAFDPLAGHPFRLAGTRVCALFCRELKGEPFARFWDIDSKPSFQDLISIVADEAIGLVAGITAHTANGLSCDLEMLLLPLAQGGQLHARTLGVLAPITAPYWLGAHQVERLSLNTLRHLEDAFDTAAVPRLVAFPSTEASRRKFAVYQGGRA